MSKHYETNSVHPRPLGAFQPYQENKKRRHGLGDLNNKQTNDLPS